MCSGDAIPPDSTLVFEIEHVHTADGPVPPNAFKQIDVDKDHSSRTKRYEVINMLVTSGTMCLFSQTDNILHTCSQKSAFNFMNI